MNEYENEMKSNPFTLSFGNKPFEYVSRESEKTELIEKLTSETPASHCFIITGVRGSGKTVMLNAISKRFKEDEDWVVVGLNPEDDMREALAAKLYTSSRIKHLFLEKDFSFSFQGLTFSISGKNPVLNIEDLLEKMMKAISRRGKKVLICIDEASNNRYMRQFALSFQMLIGQDCPLFVLATGLFENISSLENESNLNFLIRAPKTFLTPLNPSSIAFSYESTLHLSHAQAIACAKLTKGYAFAFQLLGYLMFEQGKKEADQEALSSFDRYLDEYAYSKIWSTLSKVERSIVSSFPSNSPVDVASILEKTKRSKEYLSRYRDRLIKKGILVSPERGKLSFALPRFKEFIESRLAYFD